MRRTVGTDLQMEVEAPARLAFQVGIAAPHHYDTDEDLAVTIDDRPLTCTEIAEPVGGRTWVVDVPAGQVRCHYEATLSGSAPPSSGDLAEQLLYLRPSRYCESDRLAGFAGRLFDRISEPRDILAAVSSWVGTQLEYVSGSSGGTDGAADTLLSARGVCRDFAHLAVTLLRAKDIPARMAAVYAPGLQPMDFHAVAEACIDGAWYVVDSTLLAPRSSLVRIATGRDASDTAFLTNYGGRVTLTNFYVTATVDGPLPEEAVADLIQLR